MPSNPVSASHEETELPLRQDCPILWSWTTIRPFWIQTTCRTHRNRAHRWGNHFRKQQFRRIRPTDSCVCPVCRHTRVQQPTKRVGSVVRIVGNSVTSVLLRSHLTNFGTSYAAAGLVGLRSRLRISKRTREREYGPCGNRLRKSRVYRRLGDTCGWFGTLRRDDTKVSKGRSVGLWRCQGLRCSVLSGKKTYDPTLISRPSSELIRLSMMNGRLWDKTLRNGTIINWINSFFP